jgi:probable HAF family extracellular repeat protein
MYTVTDLGVLPGDRGSYAWAINNLGHPAGVSGTSHRSGWHWAFIWRQGVLTDLGLLPGYEGIIFDNPVGGINDSDQVVGGLWLSSTSNRPNRAWIWDNGSLNDLGSPPGYTGNVHAAGINNSGQVAVTAADILDVSLSRSQAFIWLNGFFSQPLGIPPGDKSASAYGINDKGQVAGVVIAGDSLLKAVVWHGVDNITNLGTLPGSDSSWAYAINNSTQVVGCSFNWKGTYTGSKAFLWEEGAMTALGTLGGDTSYAYALNNRRQVVGYSFTAKKESRAFIWENGVMTDLNDLLPPNSGWILYKAYGINDKGQIVGVGYHAGPYEDRAFLLTPRASTTSTIPLLLLD